MALASLNLCIYSVYILIRFSSSAFFLARRFCFSLLRLRTCAVSSSASKTNLCFFKSAFLQYPNLRNWSVISVSYIKGPIYVFYFSKNSFFLIILRISFSNSCYAFAISCSMMFVSIFSSTFYLKDFKAEVLLLPFKGDADQLETLLDMELLGYIGSANEADEG